MPTPMLIATSISAAVVQGLIAALLPTFLAFLQQKHGLNEAQGKRLDKLLFLSWLPFMLLAGWLVDHWGLRESLFIGSLGLALAVPLLALGTTYRGLFAAVLGLGFTGACLTVASINLMPQALALAPRWSTAATLGLGFVFVGSARLLTPRLLPWLGQRYDFHKLALTLGVICLVPATLAATVHIPPLVQQTAFLDFRFGLLVVVAVVYLPVEFSLEIWPKNYLAEIGYAGRVAVRLLVAFWCAYLLFRFGLTWMIRADNEAWLVLFLLILSSMMLGNLAGAYAPSSGYIGLWCIGGCYGPIWPAMLAIALSMDGPRGMPGEAIGILCALRAAGSLAVQPLMGAYSGSHTPRESMRLLMLLGLVLAAPMLVLALVRG